MKTWRVIATLAVTGVTTLGSLGAIAHPARTKARSAKTAAVENQHKALLGFQHDLISLLALRADATPLLAAAQLSRPLTDPAPATTFHKLIARAAKAPGSGPAVTWMQLVDCQPKLDTCPNAQALDQLLQQAPDNAAGWLLKLGRDQTDLQAAAARQDLAKAAAASVYDDYVGASEGGLASAVTILPPSAATYNKATGGSPAGVQYTIVAATAQTLPRPVLPVVADYCEKKSSDEGIKADCLKLGKLLEWGSSPLSRSLGLHLRQTLSPDADAREEAKRAWNSLVWQVQNFAQLSARAQVDPALASHLLSLAGHGGTEMSLIYAALRDQGIALDAPSGWTPGPSH